MHCKVIQVIVRKTLFLQALQVRPSVTTALRYLKPKAGPVGAPSFESHMGHVMLTLIAVDRPGGTNPQIEVIKAKFLLGI